MVGKQDPMNESELILCSECGAQVSEADQLCPNCGIDLTATDERSIDQINEQDKANAIQVDEEKNIPRGEETSQEPMPETVATNVTTIGRKNSSWDNAIFSGIVSGIILAVVRNHFGNGGIIIIVIVYSFCITNPNFGFSWLQKAFATLIMIGLGVFGKEITAFIQKLIE